MTVIAIIEVVLVQHLRLYVSLQTEFEGGVVDLLVDVLNRQYQFLKPLLANAIVITLQAASVVGQFSFKELTQQALVFCSFEALLQGLEQDPIEFLCILLIEGFLSVPLE